MYSLKDYTIEFESKEYYLIRSKDGINSGRFKIDKKQLEDE
jgi:hypothetical protein